MRNGGNKIGEAKKLDDSSLRWESRVKILSQVGGKCL